MDDRVGPFFCITSKVGGGQDDFVLVFDPISLKVEVTVNLKDLSFELVTVSMVQVGLVTNVDGSSGLGSVGSVHSNVAHLEGVQNVKSKGLE